MTTVAIRTQARTLPAQGLAAALTAFTLGALLVFTVGFAGSQTLHAAAHDTRHAIGFPCH